VTLLQIVNFQAVIDQIARERRVSREALESIERMREWRFQIRLYSLLTQHYYIAIHEHDLNKAERLYSVLKHYRPRYQP
jgi:hypothetical protein